jgi:uncharacterized membrane protein
LILSLAVIAPSHFNAQAVPPTPPQYKIVYLQAPFSGVTSTFGYGINDLGEVVGSYQINTAPIGYPLSTAQHGFVLKKGSYTTIDVPFAGATNTVAAGINNLGVVVGSYLGSDGSIHGFSLKRGVFTSIDFTGPDALNTTASAINDDGTIIGYYYDLNSQQNRGYILARGRFSAIDAPYSGACCTRASGFNDRGEIVGNYLQGEIPFGFTIKQGAFHSFDWSFPADFPNPFASQNALPLAINNRGEMAGPGFVFLHGKFISLGDLGLGLLDVCANGVNDRGVIVGNTLQAGLPQAGFILIPAERDPG